MKTVVELKSASFKPLMARDSSGSRAHATHRPQGAYPTPREVGHSLRAGFVTQALDDGADPFKVMRVTGHKRIETLKVYDRRYEAFRNHAGRISYEPRPTWAGPICLLR